MLQLPTFTGSNASSPQDGSGLEVAVFTMIALKVKATADIPRCNGPEVTGDAGAPTEAAATGFLPS
jgi:hypothetical protein